MIICIIILIIINIILISHLLAARREIKRLKHKNEQLSKHIIDLRVFLHQLIYRK